MSVLCLLPLRLKKTKEIFLVGHAKTHMSCRLYRKIMSIHVPDAKNIKLINNKWNICVLEGVFYAKMEKYGFCT